MSMLSILGVRYDHANATILIIAYTMLKTGRTYFELGGNYLEQINKAQLQRYFAKRLQRLGLKVAVEPVAQPA